MISIKEDLKNLFRKKNYTIKDLVKAKELYNINFKDMVRYVDTYRHKIALNREIRLNSILSRIRAKLKIREVVSICPINEAKKCEFCTGYYKLMEGDNTSKKIYISVPNDEKGAMKCCLSDSDITNSRSRKKRLDK